MRLMKKINLPFLLFMLLSSILHAQQKTDNNIFSLLPGTWQMKHQKGNMLIEKWEKKDNETLTGTSHKV